VAATLLIIIAMLTLNGTPAQRPRFKGGPITLDLKPDAETADTTPKQAVSRPEPEPKQPAPPPRPIPPVTPPQLPTAHPFYIPLTREENEAADIYKLPHAAGTGAGARQASTAGDSRPVGTAPNGEPLYAAQWYRRPTHAELSFYFPAHVRTQEWGVVACRTIAAYHVDDCVELGSSPGSHLAGAVRQAAWQFLVRPPRLGGRELVGTWVSIQIVLNPVDEAEKPGDAAQSGDRSSGVEP
jgi:protein TonB